MDLAQACAAVRSRSDELIQSGPGRIDVAKIHQINDVQALRSGRDALSEPEALAIRQTVVELESHLLGIEAIEVPKDSFMSRFNRVLKGGQTAAPTAGDLGPKRPPPKALLDAAEAWLIAVVTDGRVDVDASALTEPWSTARVTPID